MNKNSLVDKEVLASTYFDSFSTFRPIKKKVKGETLFLKGEEGEIIYSDEPCAICVKKVSALNDKGSHYETSLEYKIFTLPDKQIKENDFVVVVSSGRVYKFLAGATAHYESHNEVILSGEVKA